MVQIQVRQVRGAQKLSLAKLKQRVAVTATAAITHSHQALEEPSS